MRNRIVFLALLVVGLSACSGGSSESPRPWWAQGAEIVQVWDTIATSDDPVFYTRDPKNEHKLIAYDWNGKRRGELVVAASEPFGLNPSADGTMVLLTYGHIVSGGKKIGEVAHGTWADDDEHLCTFTGAEETTPNPRGFITNASLFLQSTTGQPTEVIHRGYYGRYAQPEVLACSITNDWAVVAQDSIGEQSLPAVIRLSDGAVISEVGDDLRAARFIASLDGSLLAEDPLADEGPEGFIIRTLPSGDLLTTVPGGRDILFSGDNSRVLVTQELDEDRGTAKFSVVDIATGQTVWAGVLSPGFVLARPHSPDFIVAGRVSEGGPLLEPGERRVVWLVPGSGQPEVLLEEMLPS